MAACLRARPLRAWPVEPRGIAPVLVGHPVEPLGLGQRRAGDEPKQVGFPHEVRAEDVEGLGGVPLRGRVVGHGATE
jgi:hypothetical protein